MLRFNVSGAGATPHVIHLHFTLLSRQTLFSSHTLAADGVTLDVNLYRLYQSHETMRRAHIRGTPRGGRPPRGSWQQLGGTISLSGRYGDEDWGQSAPVSNPFGGFPNEPFLPGQDARTSEPEWAYGFGATPYATATSSIDEQSEIARLRREIVQYRQALGERGHESQQYANARGMGRGAHTRIPDIESPGSSQSPFVHDEDVAMDDGTSSSGDGVSRTGYPHRGRGRAPYRGHRGTSVRTHSRVPYERPPMAQDRMPVRPQNARDAYEYPPMGSISRSSSFSHPREFAQGGRETRRYGRGNFANMTYHRPNGSEGDSTVESYRMRFRFVADEIDRVRAAMRESLQEGMHTAIWKLDEAAHNASAKDPEQRTAVEQFIVEQWSKDMHPGWYKEDRKEHRKALKERAYINVAPDYTRSIDDWYVYYSKDVSARYQGLRRESNGRPDIHVLEGLVMALRIVDPNTPERMAQRTTMLDKLATILQSTKKYEARVKGQNIAIVEKFKISPYAGTMPPTEKDLVNHLASCGIQLWDVRLIFRLWARYWCDCVKEDSPAESEALDAQPAGLVDDEAPSSSSQPADTANEGGKITEAPLKSSSNPLPVTGDEMMEVDHMADSGAVSA